MLSDMESNTTYNNSLLVSAFKEDKLLALKKTFFLARQDFQSSTKTKLINIFEYFPYRF
jgi:hypothetical protein